MNGYFVTGTDTNVGKTVLSALLVAALDANYWKPIQTGSIEGTDRDSVRRFAEVGDDRLLPEAYIFEPPVSPHLAAREAGARIRLDDLPWPPARGGSAPERSWIVEGAGGALVPINESETMVDLMRRIGLPVVIASRTSLGTINHTLLTLAALRGARLAVHSVVLIGDENSENHRAIEHYGQVRVLGRIPRFPSIDRAALLRTFDTHFDRAAFLARNATLGHAV
ncbi:MAG TPA: dethiobiotin synthase [Methylomirabilota bacterium]|nr:dethiobiotin synthase [Methylomirabilota bacterium]